MSDSAEKAQLSEEDATKDATSDLINRQDATTIPVMPKEHREYQTMNLDDAYEQGWFDCQKCIEELPSAEPERLSDDDFETIRIHLNAQKEKLCNQQKWEEAEEYQCIIDRFMAFASAESEVIRCRDCKHHDGIRCFRWNSTIITGFDDYCSNAERRGE